MDIRAAEKLNVPVPDMPFIALHYKNEALAAIECEAKAAKNQQELEKARAERARKQKRNKARHR